MAQNKKALIRYKTINNCLKNTYKQWTLEDLIEACSQALFEYEDKESFVSKRTIQLDIQMMRSDKLGYNAPIEVYHRKYYKYTDPEYSITNIPVTHNDLNVLHEAVDVLQHFKDFSLFNEMGDVLKRLEDVVYTTENNRKPIIHLDKNEHLKGLEFLDVIYKSINQKKAITIDYKSFKARKASSFVFHPFMLKEFNNRWFVVGKRTKNKPLLTLALDRIIATKIQDNVPYIDEDFNGDAYYKDVIGVTVNEGSRPVPVVFKVDVYNAPYVLTKPLHNSQELVEHLKDGSMIFKIVVQQNFELERLLLGFGETLQVLQPKSLVKRIKSKLQAAYQNYN
ncbi:helix-turn-helix transcriptional regulator [Zhouia sp. PK063]|uniref:helix-turn-helix transcriptional regulator n=1 Tax=Zhouia sp. PK063 TaxID=3373602 RepID=UPI003788D2E4